MTIETQELDIVEYYGEATLRWYQVAARNATIQALAAGEKRILIVQPTGTGKTITIACTVGSPEVRKALKIETDRPLRVIFFAHTHRLLSQAEQTFAAENNVELIVQSMFSPIPQTVLDQGWDICVLDESHHEAASSFQYHLEKLGDFPIIGLTATPDRADGCLIKFDVIVEPLSREQAVKEGWLADTKIHTFVDVPSKSKVQVITDILNHFASQMGQTMVFVRTRAEASAISTVIRELGYDVEFIADQRPSEVNQILDNFSLGKVQFLVNCNKINEGVDVKGCTDVLLGRTYGSYAQLNQVIGRAARPDSECNVWELVNPLSGRNLDTTVVVGTPLSHRLISKEAGKWRERQFDYVTHRLAVQTVNSQF